MFTVLSSIDSTVHTSEPSTSHKADAGIRTQDPFLTMEVLYQLSYDGETLPETEVSAGNLVRLQSSTSETTAEEKDNNSQYDDQEEQRVPCNPAEHPENHQQEDE